MIPCTLARLSAFGEERPQVLGHANDNRNVSACAAGSAEMPASFTARDVIEYLDECVIDEPYCFFMDLEHGYFCTANSRLTLYADGSRWAIVFEKSGYHNRGREIGLELNFFGNCLQNLDRAGADDRYICNAKTFTLVDWDALKEIESGFESVSPAATSVRLRGKPVKIPATKDEFARWVPGILGEVEDQEFPRPNFEDLGRFLAFAYADLCRATDAEKRLCLPADLPEIMTLDEWHHRYYYHCVNGPDNKLVGDAPSTYETFPLLAEVLATRDPSRFHPKLPPSNHWTNWPEAGRL